MRIINRHGKRTRPGAILDPMTLLEYFVLTTDVSSTLVKVKDAIGKPPDELELLTSRLSKACDTLTKAKCCGASTADLRKASRLIEKGRRLVFALKVTGSLNEFPRVFVDDGA